MSENQKKIWITGASSGIGKAVAEKFAKEGWKVAVSARRKELLDDLAKNQNIESSKQNKSNTLEEENTLGKLVISEDTLEISNNEGQALEEKITDQNKVLNNLSPEEQLQFALDQMMKKNYNKSKISLEEFIEKFPENQLSG